MKTLTVTKVARNFSAVMDDMEAEQEEILLLRNHRPVARLVPEPPALTALEVLGDLYRTLDDKTADALAKSIDDARSCNETLLFSPPTPKTSRMCQT